MSHSISKQLRTLFLSLAAVLVGLLLVLIASMYVTNARLKQTLAEQVAREARNDILAGDYRAALGTLRASLGGGFLGAVYRSHDGEVVLDATTAQGDGFKRLQAHQPSIFMAWLEGEIKVPLNTTPQDALGGIHFRYNRTEGAGVWIAAWFAMSLLSVFLGRRAKHSILGRHKAELEHRNSLAIARTTQALAHDVRRPFSMLKSIVQIVEGTDDPGLARELLSQTLPEVNQAMASVEGMIQDVMHMGGEAKLLCDEVAPRALVRVALNEIFLVHPEAQISLRYNLRHTHQVLVDTTRLARVFANILGNAIQAMREKGEIWIHTSEKPGFVEFMIGNSGSFIPSENLPKLFDAFFTAEKKGGTGLGLAIAKKIVEAHGGFIFCRSERSQQHPNGMVEFVFTLPAAQSLDVSSEVELPLSSKQVQEQQAGLRRL